MWGYKTTGYVCVVVSHKALLQDLFPISLSAGSSLKDAGGDSFLEAVKEISDKQSLAVGDGKS